MSRIFLLALATVALAAAQSKGSRKHERDSVEDSRGDFSGGSRRHDRGESWRSDSVSAMESDEYDSESMDDYPRFPDSPFGRRKRQVDTDPDPFVGTEEGLQGSRHRHGGRRDSHDDDDSHRHSDHSDSRDNDVSDEFDHHNRPQFIRPPVFGPGFIPIQQNPGPILVQNPGPFPIQPSTGPMIVQQPMPSMEPVLISPPAPLPIEDGDGLIIADPSLPQILPQPEAQGGFRGPSSGRFPTTTTTTTTAPPPQSSRPSGIFPSATVTCASVRCPSGATCRMENSRRSREPEPVCAFLDSSDTTGCRQLRCAAGFTCEMQQPTPCPPNQPCPPNPVCVENSVITAPPLPTVSCDNVRCGPGTLCRIQTVDNCLFAPCALQAVCISPCSSVTCPSNSQCKVEEKTMATSCVPNARTRSVCDGVRCGFGKRCNVVRNCHWSRECREEAKCE